MNLTGLRTILTSRGTALVTLLVALAILGAPGRSSAVGSVSTLAPRPMGMGGAFLAVEDEIVSAVWNPAALSPPRCRRGWNVRIHGNILGAPAIVRETGLLTGVHTQPYADLPVGEKVALAVGSAIKGITLRRGQFFAGLVFVEERLDPVGLVESQGLADPEYLLNEHASGLSVGFELDPRVSLGFTQLVFAGRGGSDRRVYGAGRIYGALLRPNDEVTVGFTYFDFSRGFHESRSAIEGFGARTMNAGITYRPVSPLLVSFDLRDMAEKHAATSLEPRVGLELNLWGRGAIRAGAYREDEGETAVLSLGAGAIPMVACFHSDEGFRSDGFVLNYAVLLADGSKPRHLISALLHF